MAEPGLEFEWDEAKARSNLDKHGVSFFTAAATFRNERLERIDDREDYGEVRWIAWAAPKRGLSCRLRIAQQKRHPHHQRPEGEQT